MDRPTTLAVLPRGEAIRNFVYTGCLASLRPEHHVTVASVHPSDEIWNVVTSAADDAVVLEPATEHPRVSQIRALLDHAHSRYVWSEVHRFRAERRDFEAKERGTRVRGAGLSAFARVTGSRSGVQLLSRVERSVSNRYPAPTSTASRAAESADIVFNGSHIHAPAATPVVASGRRSGATTVAFLFSWDNLTSQGRLLDIYDHFLVWNESIRDDLLRIYPHFDPARVHVTGTPQFDGHFDPRNHMSRQGWADLVGVDATRPVVLYSTGMPWLTPGEPYIVEQIADALATMSDLGSPQLLVRVYAKDTTDQFDDLRLRRRDIAFVPPSWEPNYLTPLPADSALWASTLLHVDAGINIASTVSLELAMFDKPILNIAYTPPGIPPAHADFSRYYRFDHYRPVVASGAVTLVDNASMLSTTIREAIEHPDRQAGVRKALLDQFFGHRLDGEGGLRVAAALRRIAGER